MKQLLFAAAAWPALAGPGHAQTAPSPAEAPSTALADAGDFGSDIGVTQFDQLSAMSRD